MFAGPAVFGAVQRELCARYRVVAYSRRHHAPNPWPDDGASYTMNQHADDLVAFIRGLRVERAHVVAMSFAANLAAHVALRHPDVVRSLTLSDGVLATPKAPAAKPFLDEFSAWVERMFARIDAGDAPGAVAAYVALSGPTAWDSLPAGARAIYVENARTLLLAAADKTNGRPSCETFGTMRVPVLVLAGERTPKAIELMNEAVVACLPPGTGYAKVPSSGHYWYADNPVEAARRLADFFGRH